MDPLSDILGLLAVSRAIPLRFESTGPYALRFAAYEHIKFGAVLTGRFSLWVDGEPNPLHLDAGDCYLLTDGRPYRTYNCEAAIEEDGTAFFGHRRDPDGIVRLGEGPPDKVVIGGRFTFDLVGAGWIREALPPILHIRGGVAEAAALRVTLSLLNGESRGGAPGAGIMADRLADILLVQAIRAHLASAPPGAVNWLAGVADPRLGRALRAFHTDIAGDWTVASLAQAAGMSRSTFAQRFRARVGMAPLYYLTRWRLSRVRRDLLQTDEPFSVIAERNGYRSRASCSQAFRRLHGQSPAEMRQGRTIRLG